MMLYIIPVKFPYEIQVAF